MPTIEHGCYAVPMVETSVHGGHGGSGDDMAVLSITGVLGPGNLPTFTEKVDRVFERDVVRIAFELSRLKYLNTTSLGYFVQTKKRAERLGGDLVLVALSHYPRKALRLLGLEEHFLSFDTSEDAARHFRPTD